MSTPTRITHLVNGKPWEGTAERTGDVHNPATGEVTGKVDFASKQQMDEIIDKAHAAFKSGENVSIAKRTKVLFKFRELLEANKGEIAKTIVAEHGKTYIDAVGEINRGLEVVEFACGVGEILKGGYSENISTAIDGYSILQPLGVVGIISPFNFPAMVPMWFAPVAIACGNAVVIKPSEKDPSGVNQIAALWTEAGLPDGYMNVVHGDAEAVNALLDNDKVRSISFVGSTPIAKMVYERGTMAGKRVQALGGAKNHMLVLPDADLDLAADAAVNAGYGAAGERCMAISVLLAVDSIADELVAKIKERIATLKTAEGMVEGADMGPVITAQAKDRITGLIGEGEKAGATLVVDGREGEWEGGSKEGFFVLPTLFDNVTSDMSIYKEEIFGPVLSVVRVSGFEEGMQLINDNAYGNGTAIFTNDGGAARRFQHEVQVGMIGINVPIPTPASFYSFGGWKNSLFGDTHAHGPEGVHFFTRTKAITQRWLDPSHGGLNLGFPQMD